MQDVDVDAESLVPPRSQRHGFTVERADVVFSGTCAPCQEADRLSR